MLRPACHAKISFFGLLTLVALVVLDSCVLQAQEQILKRIPASKEPNLVRVNVISETRWTGDSVVINGKKLPDYQPRIVQVFPSTGVVLDDRGHVLTFLGYRWIEIQSQQPRIEIITTQGRTLKGKMIGIDQSAGTAVVLSLEGGLKKTPLCEGCAMQHGATVIAPEAGEDGDGIFTMKSAQILSVSGKYEASSITQGFVVTVSQPLPGIGEPILDAEHRVLGFVVGQQSLAGDPMRARPVVSPISQFLTSAEKILRAGGDIRTGWLGVFLDDTGPMPGSRVIVRKVEENSPAQKAGLGPEDVLLKWNGKEIRETRQFIRFVQEAPIGSTVHLDIQRQGRPLQVSTLIEARKPQPNPGMFVFNFPDMVSLSESPPPVGIDSGAQPGDWLGLDTVPLTPQLADSLGIPEPSGLLVVGVQNGLPFSRAGVQVGDVILALNDQPLANSQVLAAQVRTGGPGKQLRLKFLRKGVERITTIFLPKR